LDVKGIWILQSNIRSSKCSDEEVNIRVICSTLEMMMYLMQMWSDLLRSVRSSELEDEEGGDSTPPP
jgi:hypothetical protein